MIDRYKHVVFDLDNTLYNEEDYLFPVFEKISYTIAADNIQLAHELAVFLKNTHRTEGKKNLFDKLILKYNLSHSILNSLLTIQRTIILRTKMNMLMHSEHLIKTLQHKHIPVYIATNGNKEQQQNKLSQINWGSVNPSSIIPYFAADYKPKPAPDILKAIMHDHGISPSEMLFIGDTDSDNRCADNAHVPFVHVSELLHYSVTW